VPREQRDARRGRDVACQLGSCSIGQVTMGSFGSAPHIEPRHSNAVRAPESARDHVDNRLLQLERIQ
jgi:hypothetical protein